MAKGKPAGHYCKVCGQRKANEKFSGKGHAAHICKQCASLPAEEKAEQMTLNRLDGMLGRRLNTAEMKWLRNRMQDARPAVKQTACDVYAEMESRHQ